jgi:hypothetical protein
MIMTHALIHARQCEPNNQDFLHVSQFLKNAAPIEHLALNTTTLPQ